MPQVLDNHRIAGSLMRPGAAGANDGNDESRAEVDFLKRYIHYCRSQCAPRLSESAQERLAAYYVEIRDEVRVRAWRGACLACRHARAHVCVYSVCFFVLCECVCARSV